MDNLEHWNELEPTFKEWKRRARVAQHAHRIAGKRGAKFHAWVGGGAAVLAATTATGLAAQLQNTDIGRWLIALASALAALLVAIHTFRRFDVRAQVNEATRASYGAICREIEEIFSTPVSLRGDPKLTSQRIRMRLDELARTPSPSESDWKEAEQTLPTDGS